MYAAETLGIFGPRAKISIPTLTKLLQDEEWWEETGHE
jgi:hypothetical protein